MVVEARVVQQVNSFIRERPTVPAWALLIPLVAVVVLLTVAGQLPDGRLHLWVFDVGEGDAIMLKTPKGHTVLIDGGPAATSLLNDVGHNLPFWQHDLDLLVLTHPHEDHLMGLVELAQRDHIDELVETVFTATSGVQAEWLREVQNLGIPVEHPIRGKLITFQDEPEVSLKVLSPTTPDAHREKSNGDINNTSLVLKIIYGSHASSWKATPKSRPSATWPSASLKTSKQTS